MISSFAFKAALAYIAGLRLFLGRRPATQRLLIDMQAGTVMSGADRLYARFGSGEDRFLMVPLPKDNQSPPSPQGYVTMMIQVRNHW